MTICFTRLIIHGRDLLHTTTLPPHLQQTRPWGLSLVNFNIRDVRGSRLAQAIRFVKIGGFDLMILMETKISNQDYFCNSLGYYVVFLPTIVTTYGGAKVGVGLVVQDQPQVWSLELTRFHGPNMVICEVVTERKPTPIIGKYLPPSTIDHLLDL